MTGSEQQGQEMMAGQVPRMLPDPGLEPRRLDATPPSRAACSQASDLHGSASRLFLDSSSRGPVGSLGSPTEPQEAPYRGKGNDRLGGFHRKPECGGAGWRRRLAGRSHKPIQTPGRTRTRGTFEVSEGKKSLTVTQPGPWNLSHHMPSPGFRIRDKLG